MSKPNRQTTCNTLKVLVPTAQVDNLTINFNAASTELNNARPTYYGDFLCHVVGNDPVWKDS